MKYLKMIGIAAVAAMALMAFASAASATELYSSGVTQGKGTKIVAGLTVGTSAVLETTAGEPLATCTISGVEGEITEAGGASATTKGKITSLTWGKSGEGCTTTVHTLKTSTLEVHHITGTNNGTVTANAGTSVTLNLFGVSCVYGSTTGITLGTLTGGNPAVLDINALVGKEEGGFLCPSSARWTGSYTVSSPNPLLVAAS
jgi:hypothetical protein